MLELSSTGRPPSESPSPLKNPAAGGVAEGFTGKDYYQDLIKRANSVPIIQVFRHYNIKIPAGIKIITCPFKFHKGGKERTPSFEYYAHTNTFYCHGCTSGTKAVDFVSKIDNISRADAAYKILSLFESEFDENDFLDVPDAAERLKIMMEFSNTVREFRQSNSDEKGEKFIEHICSVYDVLNAKHKLDNEGLISSIDKLKHVIAQYKSCYTL
jgi:CHC2-type zinc finger protein